RRLPLDVDLRAPPARPEQAPQRSRLHRHRPRLLRRLPARHHLSHLTSPAPFAEHATAPRARTPRPPPAFGLRPRTGPAWARLLVYLDSYVTSSVHWRHGSCAAGAGGREPPVDAGDAGRRAGHR